MLRSSVILPALALAACQFLSAAWAQAYPSKPVRVIVPAGAGGGSDIPTRIIMHKVGEALGQQFVVDNRPGAGSNLGIAIAAKAAPDGYTIVLGSVANAINNALYSKLPFDIVRDFAPIALTASAANIVVVHPAVPARSIAELIELARARPGKLDYGSTGIGTTSHLAGAMFNDMAKINTVHVPYKGVGPSLAGLIAAEHTYLFGIPVGVLPLVKSGRLRALAVTSAKRLPSLPDMPTVAETLPGFEAITWWGMMVPAGTPRPIIVRLNTEILKALALPDVREQLATHGVDIDGSTPEEFSRQLRDEIAKWARVIKAAGVRAE